MNSAILQYPERLKAARERLIGTSINDPALNYCIAGLARVEEVLRRPLRVVVLGENNSGKTSVTDLIIGQGLLPTGVVSNTHVPVLVGYGEQPAIYGVDYDETRIRIDSDDGDDPLTDLAYRAVQVMLPLPALKSYQILDTPPSASPSAFVGDADIVIWCTVSTRAWTESERAAWAALPKRCSRNALLVGTHKDGLDTEEDVAHVKERLRNLTSGLFRDVILVDAEGVQGGDAVADDDPWNGARELRDGLQRVAESVVERRTRKAEKIVRRLARLTFHHFGSDEVRPDSVDLLLRWQTHAKHLLELLQQGRQTVPESIETLLVTYAYYAEKLRPGVVRAEDTVSGASARALTAPIRWPQQTTAAARLVQTLASDLTGLLRMLAGQSTYADPAVRAEYQTARAIVLALADLDGAFDALGRMLGSSLVSEPVARAS